MGSSRGTEWDIKMTQRGMTTIDQALAELEKLRGTLQALRLMPETMPQNPIDLAMTKTLRGLNFEASPPPFNDYTTNDVAGFDEIEVAWSEHYAYAHGMVTVRALGKKKDCGRLSVAVSKLINIPRGSVTGSAEFARTLFGMIAVPSNFVPMTEHSTLAVGPEPMKWPEPGMGYWWGGEPTALAAQLAKGPGGDYDDEWRKMVRQAKANPKLEGARPDNTVLFSEMTEAERKACEELDKGRFF